MTDRLTPEQRSRAMRAVKSSNTSLERLMSSLLWARGYRFRRNVTSIAGKPDFALKGRKIAIFVDSCFWHSCPLHGRVPADITGYWASKLEANAARDARVTRELEEDGWTVVRVWEHDLHDSVDEVIAQVDALMNGSTGA